MFVKGVKLISKSIFPIFRLINIGDQSTIGVVGTGFFIDSKGSFLTAAHIIDNSIENCQYVYFGCLPYHKIAKPVTLEEVKRNDDSDIFLGKISEDNGPPVKISNANPAVGKSLCMCGYPMPSIKLTADNKIDTTSVRVYYQPSFVVDGYRGLINVGDREINVDGFMLRDTVHPGMSGGPVFDVDGVVYGMNNVFITRKLEPGDDPKTLDNGVSTNCESLLKFINTK